MAGISYERKADAYLETTEAPRFDLWGVESEPVIDWLRTRVEAELDLAEHR